ncbi:hypothetical protein PVAND_005540 [Polypedilum vanderplanki]|uniref:Uncharacterized protein n=1 Tax=Polypedilum vanderplanki TaxID=319348 RepID=A0A9J6C1C4_POLVA|nr:hypothetical protein PVAND_005540 [Polypedilum vanderplanki]
MNKFACSLLLLSFIGFINADQEPVLKSTQIKNENPLKEDNPVYVPAATSGNVKPSSGGGVGNDVTAILNNPAFSTYVPQDVVQQYASQYGHGYVGEVLEGFLIPGYERPDYPVAPPPSFSTLSILRSFLPGPKIILAIAAKIVALLASAVGVVFFGGAITSFVCAFTPLCTITFFGRPLALLKQETKDIVEKIGEELTADRVKRAADLFKLAMDKYQAMNRKS